LGWYIFGIHVQYFLRLLLRSRVYSLRVWLLSISVSIFSRLRWLGGFLIFSLGGYLLSGWGFSLQRALCESFTHTFCSTCTQYSQVILHTAGPILPIYCESELHGCEKCLSKYRSLSIGSNSFQQFHPWGRVSLYYFCFPCAYIGDLISSYLCIPKIQ
jgi:hypothetical protein